MKSYQPRSPLRTRPSNILTPPVLLFEGFSKSPQSSYSTSESLSSFLSSVADSVNSHTAAIRELEKGINGRVTAAEFTATMATKVDFTDVSGKIAEIKVLLDKKLDSIDLDIRMQELEGKVSVRVDKMTEYLEKTIKSKAEVKELLSFMQEIRKENSKSGGKTVRADEKEGWIRDCDDTHRELARKIERALSELRQLREDVEAVDQYSIQKKLVHMQQKTNTKADLNALQTKITLQHTSLTDLFTSFSREITEIHKKIQHDLDSRLKNISNLCERCESDLSFIKRSQSFSLTSKQNALSHSFSDLIQDLSSFKKSAQTSLIDLSARMDALSKAKPEREEIRNALHEINKKLHMKLDKHLRTSTPEKENRMEPEHSHKSSEESPFNYSFSPSMQRKTKTHKQFEDIWPEFAETIANRFAEISKQLVLKCSIKEICTLLDMKANVEDVNSALEDIHRELDERCG
jgi:DNA repair exonuclease SbcCD ATPase subunit